MVVNWRTDKNGNAHQSFGVHYGFCAELKKEENEGRNQTIMH